MRALLRPPLLQLLVPRGAGPAPGVGRGRGRRPLSARRRGGGPGRQDGRRHRALQLAAGPVLRAYSTEGPFLRVLRARVASSGFFFSARVESLWPKICFKCKQQQKRGGKKSRLLTFYNILLHLGCFELCTNFSFLLCRPGNPASLTLSLLQIGRPEVSRAVEAAALGLALPALLYFWMPAYR